MLMRTTTFTSELLRSNTKHLILAKNYNLIFSWQIGKEFC